MDKKFIQNKFSEKQLSIADLFTGPVIGSSSTTASLSEDAESSRFLKAYTEQENRFVPQVNFATASNFARFGSAVSYYEDAFTRIHNQYPYDGSQSEKVLWNLSSSYLDKYVFDNLYPRTNGFITVNSSSNTYTTTKSGEFYSSSAPEYVFFKGGPHADPFGNYKIELEPGLSTTAISKANVYDTGSKRTNNLEIDLETGITIEFWMKKDGWVTTPDTSGSTEVVFHNATTGAVGNDSECLVYTQGYSAARRKDIGLKISSGSAASKQTVSFGLTTGLDDIGDGNWHHYAITAKTSGSSTVANLYVDGAHVEREAQSNTLNLVTGSQVGALGALAGHTKTGGTVFYGPGWGNIVSASFDEVRYWKIERSSKEIGRYYISHVDGGTNTDTANTDLGVYFKFNEGITQTASVDQTILDYSGRISNGTFINYNATTGRSTDSAIVQSGKSTIEFRDPILYSFHPSVKSKLSELRIKASEHDFNNSNSLINGIPSWIVENDETEGTGELSKLIQISANYLDSLYLQIEALPTIKNINYASSSNKPHFFNDRLLKDYGFDVDEILTDVSLFAYSKTRDEDRMFERKLYEVKNQIYKNIYNNLVYIYKSKGTIKSFRNLLRCVGVDEELVRLNLYGMNTDWQARTNSRNVSSRLKYLDFFNNNSAIVYGYPETGNSNSTSFISGSGDASSGIDLLTAITMEADVLFPKYPSNASNYSKNFSDLTSSIFGMDGVEYPGTPDNLTWATNNISSSLQVFSIRKQKQTTEDNPEVSFMLSGSMLSAPLTTPVYKDVYDNTSWKFAVRLKHRAEDSGLDLVSGSLINDVVEVEFVGANVVADSILHQFKVTGSLLDGPKYGPFVEPKRIYCGARRENFTGSLLFKSDVFASNIRYWNSYLSDETLSYHAKNDASYGVDHPHENTYLLAGKDTTGLSTTEMPKISSLALNWNLEQVTGSDSSGRFVVSDFSSGSDDLNDYKLSNIVQRQHTGRGDFFATSSVEVTEIKYNSSTRLVPFDQINSDDMVDIVDFEGEIFTRESRPQEYFFAFEKSMYANVSDDMLKMFATIRDFHNLVGEPVNRYRKEYKEMEKLRQLFFRKVDNTPDVEKFVEYFKWIDNSISTMMRNLIPASANFARNIRTMIESHVLERNKIETKFPTLELNQPEPIGQIKAINELTYDWKHGHHPTSGDQADACLYWHDRAERDSAETTSGDSTIDAQRETVRVRKNTVVSGSSYVLRKLTRPYRFGASRTEDFKIDNAKLNFVQTELNRGSATQSIVLQNIENFKVCNDNLALRSKRKVDFQANVNGSLLKGRAVAPFTVYSSSVSTGYKSDLLTFGNEIEINNNHTDAYGTETQEPLQGPFSKIHVGGKSSRKVAPFTAERSRPEDYDLTVSSDSITLSQRSLEDPQSSPYFLDEIAKRPVVIKNIKTDTSSVYLGNYSKEYQIVQTVGADTQRGWLKDNFNSVTQVTPEILNLSGNINFNTFARTGSSLQSVTIADRFSGPGSPEAMSLGYLDPASHTFSVYNGINYRNMTVRLPRSNITFTASNSAVPATPYYQFRPFGGNPDQNLRTLQTDVPLRNRLRHPMSFEGFDMYLSAPNASVLTASIHRVNRNRKNAPIPFGVFVINHADRDNAFVQRAIPRSDRQYSWITASLSASHLGPNIDSFKYYSGGGDGLTAPLGYAVKTGDIQFDSASVFGSYIIPALGQTYGSDSSKFSLNNFIPNDFVGLNNNINDPISASTNTIGYPTLASVDGFTYNYTGGLIKFVLSSRVPSILNGLIHHRQGPYGWPTWKQIRGNQHPVIRNHKLTNTFSTIDREAEKPTATLLATLPDYLGNEKLYSATKVTNDGFRQIINLTESVVTVNYKPMSINIRMKGVGPDGLPQDSLNPIEQKFKFTYANESAYFAEEQILQKITADNYLNLIRANRSRSRAYKSTVDLYKPGTFDSLSRINPLQEFESLKASQVIFPRTRNTFLKRTKMRNNYTEVAGTGSSGYDRIKHRTFWRNNSLDRQRTDQVALNSQGMILSQSLRMGVRPSASPQSGSFNMGAVPGLSVWPLEGRYIGTAAQLSEDARGYNSQIGSFVPSSEQFILQMGVRNKAAGGSYPATTASLTGELYTSGLYRSVTYNTDSGSIVDLKNRFVTASARYHSVDWNMSAYSGSDQRTSQTIQSTPGRIPFTASSNIEWTTNIDSGKNPWYDSYEDYSADLRKIGKDYSIIPEFNISDHMEHYIVNFGSDFLAPMPSDKFIIQGINNSASVNNNFYKEYSHSDFLKNFELVIEDHKEIANVSNIKMTCRGLKKLLPYNGFYPMTRTLQMATLLSESLGSKIVGSGSSVDSIYAPTVYPPLLDVQGLQALLQPLMAPGILYNTIKSGIAVDWALYTGSAPVTSIQGGTFGSLLDIKNYISSSANFRLPFEAIYNLDNIPISKQGDKKEIYALANEGTDAHFTWNGDRNHDLYEKAMNNFLAESVNLFLHHSRLTSFISKKMSEVSFIPNKSYQMSVDLYKTAGFLITEGASADSIASSDLWKSYDYITQSYAWHGTAKRGIIYGPAVRFFDVKTASNLSAAAWPYCEQNDPAFAPYTPPYFYGKSTVDFTYVNYIDHTETPALATVLASITASYSNDLSDIPTGSYYTSSVASGNGLPWRSIVSSSSPAIQTIMNISSSLSLFGKSNDALKQYDSNGQVTGFIDPEDPTDQERWVISTRYECPVLNFNHYANDTKARGMWNGYGNIPNYDAEGIFIRLRETSPELIYGLGVEAGNTGSLLQKFFTTETKRKPVGKIAEDFEKSISECIVAIPYLPGKSNDNSIADKYNCIYSPDDDKYFFPIEALVGIQGGGITGGPSNILTIEEQILAPSAAALRDKMKKFVFPPRYDWVNNAEPVLAPFAMFTFEFTHRFTRQELADIWQGVMPEISTKVVPETTTLNVPVSNGELLHRLLSKLSSENTSTQQINQTVKELRWMVFKVKQRARNVYANITEDLTDNIAGTLKPFVNKDILSLNDDTYSYNWPYDFCSLVELGKLEAEIEIK